MGEVAAGVEAGAVGGQGQGADAAVGVGQPAGVGGAGGGEGGEVGLGPAGDAGEVATREHPAVGRAA